MAKKAVRKKGYRYIVIGGEYQLWDTEGMNMVGFYKTQDEALAALYDTTVQLGDIATKDLQLERYTLRVGEHNLTTIASGEKLFDMVLGWANLNRRPMEPTMRERARRLRQVVYGDGARASRHLSGFKTARSRRSGALRGRSGGSYGRG